MMTLTLDSNSLRQSSSEQLSLRELVSLSAVSTRERVRRHSQYWLSLNYEKALRMSRSLVSRQPTGTPSPTASSMRPITSEQFSYRMASSSFPLGPASSNFPSMKWQICLIQSVPPPLSMISAYCFWCSMNRTLISWYLVMFQMLLQADSGSPASSSHLALSMMESWSCSSMESAVLNSMMACSQFLSSMKMTPRVQKQRATLSYDFYMARSMSSSDYAFMPRQRYRIARQQYMWAFQPARRPCSISYSILTNPSVLMGQLRYSSLRMTAMQKQGQGRLMKAAASSNFYIACSRWPCWQWSMPQQMWMLQAAAVESVLGSLGVILRQSQRAVWWLARLKLAKARALWSRLCRKGTWVVKECWKSMRQEPISTMASACFFFMRKVTPSASFSSWSVVLHRILVSMVRLRQAKAQQKSRSRMQATADSAMASLKTREVLFLASRSLYSIMDYCVFPDSCSILALSRTVSGDRLGNTLSICCNTAEAF